MIRINNLIALITHIFIRILILFLSVTIGFNSSLIRSEDARINRMAFQEKKFWIIFIIAIVIYFVVGLALESSMKKLHNFLSVSLVSIIGLTLLFAYCFKVKGILGFNVYNMYMVYLSFDLFNFTYHLNVISNVKILFLNIIFAIIPSLFMWLGLESHKKIFKKSIKVENL